MQWKAWYGWVAVAVVALAVVAVYLGPWVAITNPPLNSAISAHGNTDWHIDTAEEFLFGTDMNGNPSAANHCPASWTRTHMHVGLTNANHFYYDASLATPGDDTDATNGIDRAMLFFYAGHGNPTIWNTLGNNASTGDMLLGDDPASLRYYWQCSCEVFAHGPLNCAGSSLVYACPGNFNGASDSVAMRNVYERWGPALAPALRMACGASTDAWCHESNVDPIWDNYNNNGMDVADSFIDGLGNSHPGVIPLCITTGGLFASSTPLYDSQFTNQPNPSGDYYHIQYLGGFGTTAPKILVAEIPELLPKLELIPIPLPDPWREYELVEKADLLVSEELIDNRGPRWQVHRASGAMYARGARLTETRGEQLDEQEYLDRTQKLVEELGWREPLARQPQGSSMRLESRPRKGEGAGQIERSQKNVIVRIRRLLDIDGLEVPVFGSGGLITVQLNNDGSLLNAAKVWRPVAASEQMVATKPYEQAEEEAWQALGDAAANYRLDSWDWGYKEQAGNVRQEQMLMFYRFDFRPRTEEELLEYPPRRVEVPGLME